MLYEFNACQIATSSNNTGDHPAEEVLQALTNLQLIYSDEAREQQVALPKVGGQGSSYNCSTEQFDREYPLTSIRIYGREGSFVTGIDLIYNEGKQQQIIGSKDKSWIEIEVPEGSQLMGLFGSTDGQHIDRLGIIV